MELTPVIAIYDTIHDIVLGYSTIKWDATIQKYTARVRIIEPLFSNDVDYNIQINFYDEGFLQNYNSTENYDISLLPMPLDLKGIKLLSKKDIYLDDNLKYKLKNFNPLKGKS